MKAAKSSLSVLHALDSNVSYSPNISSRDIVIDEENFVDLNFPEDTELIKKLFSSLNLNEKLDLIKIISNEEADIHYCKSLRNFAFDSKTMIEDNFVIFLKY